jgi:hypothetical protein
VAGMVSVAHNEVPRADKLASRRGSKVLEQRIRKVEAVALAARALVDDLRGRRLAVRPDLDLLAAMLARAVPCRVQRDDKVGRLVSPATCTEADLVVRHVRTIVAAREGYVG